MADLDVQLRQAVEELVDVWVILLLAGEVAFASRILNMTNELAVRYWEAEQARLRAEVEG